MKNSLVLFVSILCVARSLAAEYPVYQNGDDGSQYNLGPSGFPQYQYPPPYETFEQQPSEQHYMDQQQQAGSQYYADLQEPLSQQYAPQRPQHQPSRPQGEAAQQVPAGPSANNTELERYGKFPFGAGLYGLGFGGGLPAFGGGPFGAGPGPFGPGGPNMGADGGPGGPGRSPGPFGPGPAGPYPEPPPFGMPDPSFQTQAGFEGLLVPNTWYGLLPWGIEGVIIVIAGIIVFAIIVVAIIGLLLWLCGIKNSIPWILNRDGSDLETELRSRFTDQWSLVNLSADVLDAIEKFNDVSSNSKQEETLDSKKKV